jgi:hypothetical protein
MNRQLKLDRNRKRVKQCPCGKSNKDMKFSPFIGYDNKGYCHSCTKTFHPEQENVFKKQVYDKPIEKPKPSFISTDTYSKYMKDRNMEDNNFFKFLIEHFDKETANLLRCSYLIGQTSAGATVFPLIDQNAKIRSGKIMRYNLLKDETVVGGLNPKRDKKSYIGWIHSSEKIKGFNFEKCLFGLHLLLEFPNRKIAIVESEKTAVICSVYMPKYTWMAVGGKSLNMKDFEPLKRLPIMLFPDLNATQEWKETAKLWNGKFNIKVSDYLETVASDQQKKDGLDIADFLIANPISKTEVVKTKEVVSTALSKLRKLNHQNVVPDENLQLLIDTLGLSC